MTEILPTGHVRRQQALQRSEDTLQAIKQVIRLAEAGKEPHVITREEYERLTADDSEPWVAGDPIVLKPIGPRYQCPVCHYIETKTTAGTPPTIQCGTDGCKGRARLLLEPSRG